MTAGDFLYFGVPLACLLSMVSIAVFELRQGCRDGSRVCSPQDSRTVEKGDDR